MALIVKIFINEKEIASYSAIRKHGQPGELCTYVLGGTDPNAWVDHWYDDGAESLAIKVLLHQMNSKHKKGQS